MNSLLYRLPTRVFLFASTAALALIGPANLRAADAAPVVNKSTSTDPVTLTDAADSWTLDNGLVRAVISKRTGALSSFVYVKLGPDGGGTGRGVGVWEEDPSNAAQVGGLTDSVTIDPSKNSGERAEVSVKGVTGGQVALSIGSPGSPNGTSNIDLELRYTLGRGDSGVYTYAIFSHPAAYGAASIGESRFILVIDRSFNWISVDQYRNLLECAPTDWGTGVVVHAKEQRIMSKGYYENSVEHKYSYSGVQYKTPAYGWSSTTTHAGIWFINPTIEYLSGGASKQELDAHFGDNGNPPPIILDYWRGTHYGGGASCNIAAGEDWSKVIGPIYIYANSLSSYQTATPEALDTLNATAGNPTIPAAWTNNANALFDDALAEAKVQEAKWPYDWVNGVDYPLKDQRGTVTGQFVVEDPLAPKPFGNFTQLTVGLAYPDAPPPAPGGGGGFGGRGGRADWAHDAKHYEFWNDGSSNGTFTITNVRPGTYELHAFAAGILGNLDMADSNITVEAGKTLDLGKIVWKPLRYGTQLWDIGKPDHSSAEFLKGDGATSWLWGWNMRYALLFPDDLTYTIGQSTPAKDWFFEEVPHATATSGPDSFINPNAKDPANQRFGWVRSFTLDDYPQTDTRGPWALWGRGNATTWTIKFNVDKPEQGTAVLRVALDGADGGGFGGGSGDAVTVNGQQVGAIRATATNAIRYNTTGGIWQELSVPFDASLLKPGENELQITVPAGDLESGLVWDYLRLELNQYYKPDGTPINPPKS